MGESAYEADCPSPFGTTAKCSELNMAGCCHSNSVMGALTYNGCDSLKRALTQLISMICVCFSLINAKISKLVSESSIMKIYPALLGWLQLCLGEKKCSVETSLFLQDVWEESRSMQCSWSKKFWQKKKKTIILVLSSFQSFPIQDAAHWFLQFLK